MIGKKYGALCHTHISILKMLRYDNLFQLRNTQLLIDRDILLVPLCIKNPTNTLSRERKVVLVLVADSEVFLNLLKEPSEEFRGPLMMRSST